MSKIKYTIRCPTCGGKFSVVSDDMPKFCMLCGAADGADDDFVPTQMNIGGSAIARSVDKMYRDAEASSEVRAEMAGDPSLKITNMRDNLREGDVAAMPVNNAVTQYADEMHKAVGFNYFQANVSDHVAAAKMGAERTTGQKALAAIQGGIGAPRLPAKIAGNWGGGMK